MMIRDKLLTLEEKIDFVTERYKAVLEERNQLLNEKDDLLSIIDKINVENNILKAERDTVIERIESLVNKL